MLTIFLTICTFSVIFCLGAGTLLWATDNQARHQRRLKKRLSGLRDLGVGNPADSLLQGPASRLPRLFQGRLLAKLELSLLQAGIHCRTEVYLGFTLLSATAFLGLGLLKWGGLGALAGGGLGIWLPGKFLAFRKHRRLGKFEKQLPDALELLGRGLKAGHAFTAGLQLVADEMAPPIGPEFFQDL